jgi:hypothetical protein
VTLGVADNREDQLGWRLTTEAEANDVRKKNGQGDDGTDSNGDQDEDRTKF